MRLRQLLEPYFLFNHEWRGPASRQAGFTNPKMVLEAPFILYDIGFC